jgi:hypothetical protein
MTPSGIEPATFWLVAQCHRVSLVNIKRQVAVNVPLWLKERDVTRFKMLLVTCQLGIYWPRDDLSGYKKITLVL